MQLGAGSCFAGISSAFAEICIVHRVNMTTCSLYFLVQNLYLERLALNLQTGLNQTKDTKYGAKKNCKLPFAGYNERLEKNGKPIRSWACSP